jgi:hypothetical protein
MNLRNWYLINEKTSVKEDCYQIAGTAYWQPKLLVRKNDGTERYYQPEGAQLCSTYDEAVAVVIKALMLGFYQFWRRFPD